VLGITFHTLQAYLRAPFYDVDGEDEDPVDGESLSTRDERRSGEPCAQEHDRGEDERASSRTLLATTEPA
jgi:hypothetical protein